MAGSAQAVPSSDALSWEDRARRSADALVVARRIFPDFNLSEDELQRAADALGMVGGGATYQDILNRAKKKPQQPWETVEGDRREFCINAVLDYHCSPADRERMALRTGATLLLMGEAGLGRKILQSAPDASFGVKARGYVLWARIAQLALYSFMIAVIAIQSVATGLYLFLVAAIVVAGVVLLCVWLLERNRWKLEREEHEARQYLAALAQIDRGAPPVDLFAADGTLRGSAS